MSRKLLTTIHLYLATFLAPIILMIAISGGLYLFGIKGTVEKTVLYEGNVSEISYTAENLEMEVSRFLQEIGHDTSFEAIKASGNTLYTRPTSTTYLTIERKNNQVTVTRETPDFVKRIVELHKGHGPQFFKTLQKITAIGLVFILLSGLWMAFSMKSMRKQAGIITAVSLLTLLFALI